MLMAGYCPLKSVTAVTAVTARRTAPANTVTAVTTDTHLPEMHFTPDEILSYISQNGTMLSFDLKGENSSFEHTFKVKNDNVAYLLSNMSSISTLPQTYLTASFTDVETDTDIPHVFMGNKVYKTLPKRE